GTHKVTKVIPGSDCCAFGRRKLAVTYQIRQQWRVYETTKCVHNQKHNGSGGQNAKKLHWGSGALSIHAERRLRCGCCDDWTQPTGKCAQKPLQDVPDCVVAESVQPTGRPG